MQNQLNLMANGTQPPNPDNLTAYKNMAGDLINSMIADLYRAGYADSGNFRALGDSVLDDLAGGAGTSAKLDRSQASSARRPNAAPDPAVPADDANGCRAGGNCLPAA